MHQPEFRTIPIPVSDYFGAATAAWAVYHYGADARYVKVGEVARLDARTYAARNRAGAMLPSVPAKSRTAAIATAHAGDFWA